MKISVFKHDMVRGRKFFLLFLCKNKFFISYASAIIEGMSMVEEKEKGEYEKKKPEEKHVDFFSSCQEKKRCIEERKNKRGGIFCSCFCACVFALLFIHLFFSLTSSTSSLSSSTILLLLLLLE